MLRKHVLALGAIVGIACSPISANAVEWTVGLGAGAAPDYEGSDDYELVPLWNLRAANLYDPNTYVQVTGPKLSSNFLAHDNLRLGLSGQYVPERDDVDNSQVDSMSTADDGILIGVLLGYDFKLSSNRVIGFEFDSRYDVQDEIGGLFTLRMNYMAPFGGGSWRFRGGVESTYASEDYMSEFFGINAADAAASGLSTFNADHGFKDVAVSTNLTYLFRPGWSATGMLKLTRLIGDAADSPVTDTVGDENQLFGGLLINYSF
jgi:outer membrane protein